MPSALMKMLVEIDGKAIEVAVVQGDYVRLEEQDRETARAVALAKTEEDYGAALGISGMYRLAFIALSRMRRRGLLPEGTEVPDDYDDFLDLIAEIAPKVDESGKPSGPAPSTGE